MQPLGHVLWIGGPPGSGKTTIATLLARRHGLRWFNTDTRTWAHRDRAIHEGNPRAIRWEAMTPDERWLQTTPAEQLELSLHRERGPMVVDDVRGLPMSPLVVAEGSTVPACVVSCGVAPRSRALWLLPTAAFQEARFGERRIPGCPAEPLYRLMTETIEREAIDHGARLLTVDATDSVGDTLGSVEAAFAGALAEGPRAESRAARRALLREANERIVAQVRGYYARPWADGSAEVVMRRFVCECGDPGCGAFVELEVRTVAAAPALAPGHG